MKNNTAAERLRIARKNAGFKSAQHAARALGKNPVTYTAHENGGRQFDTNDALLYAAKFNVPPEHLLLGDEQQPGIEFEDSSWPTNGTPELDPLVDVDDLPNERGVAPGAVAIARWQLPEDFLAGMLRVKPAHAWVFTYQSDSQFDPSQPGLATTIQPGDRVIIDASDRRPSPPGLFLVHDGTGLVINHLEVTHSMTDRKAEGTIRVSSRNPQYATYEVSPSYLRIVGRVKGKIGRL
ncbi:LexA family transcriptional regulator [Shinella sp. JR1-6]|uniref:LexA family transcriptional regulator n=1 Tax=Shinella sp. JR1-6 TaxID=2527671 RepID=UPI00102D3B09|nr:LexA family transcriptional regulator [Shinella sp. JR1-6]TAA54569.1 hypothetical protein EXZ48_26445 [Shinella sp. JR1-6]